MNANEEICHVCFHPVKRKLYETSTGKMLCVACMRRNRNCFACDTLTVKDKALRFSDGRYVCSECARKAVYEINAKRFAAIKGRLAWAPKMPVKFKIVSRETLPRRRRRTPLNFGQSKALYESHGRQLLIVSHEIEILIGLPVVLFEAIVVHELFHAWLHENFAVGIMNRDEEEWLCEHLALLYLRACRAKKPWRKVVQARREQYRFKRADEFKERTQKQVIKQLLTEARKNRKRRNRCPT
ncbi:hypothetical protein A2482_01290 [Candidatus Falkowbacteria bacterium RIFOXYC2_FULL_48_21]|uniref:Protein DA1-like domain-containing protein n=1 Tax=Candidatus Falkowbacteria bacterium RIFOXYC2_FULL_48_21 TaxID=1798005 RepID=A0A1F5T7V8_9BACT|nr:MAG: hypothetical protein A2482_01290 [Candidatus Falkowbacteria bacterium RIFOXYC2_FULL_48_21]